MGGDSFAREASRLTTAQLDSLAEYCSSALYQAGLFQGIGRYKHFTSKETHGDLDLVCAFESGNVLPSAQGTLSPRHVGRDTLPMFGIRRGLPTDKLDDPLAEQMIAKATIAKLKKEARSGVSAGGEAELESWSVGEGVEAAIGARRLAILVCRALGAREWVWNWPVLSYAVPVEKSGVELGEEDGAEPFFQVDIFPVLPFKLRFTTFVCSYSHCRHLLSQLFRLLSPSLELRYIDLQLHHTPYPGGKRIELELSSSPEALCEWLGLDFQRFADGAAFEHKEDLWRWLTDVHPNSLVALALGNMAERMRGDQESERCTPGEATDLLSPESEELHTLPMADDTPDSGTVNSIPDASGVSSLASNTSLTPFTSPPKLHRRFTTHRGIPTMDAFAAWVLREIAWVGNGPRRDSGIVLPTIPALTASPSPTAASPARDELLAVPLDPIAFAALRHFGGLAVLKDYELALEQRRQEALPLWEERKKKETVKMANIAKARTQVEAKRVKLRTAEAEANSLSISR